MKKSIWVTAYFAVVIFIFVLSGFRLRLPHLLLLFLPVAFLEKKPKDFLIHWLPFMMIIFAYDSFRSIADNLGRRVDYELLPLLERRICFGVLPTVELQQLFGENLRGAFGITLSLFYFGHFILPIICLYLLWRKNIWSFRRLCFSLALVSFLGFFTFALFPAAPPWLASQEKVIPNTDHTILFLLKALRANLPDIYIYMNPNKVAPFPSLHAAYPLLLFLSCRKEFPKLGSFLLVNLALVSFAIVAFAEHYVVDLLGGWIYAIFAYSSTVFLTKKIQK